MAAPIIDSITINPTPVPVGQSTLITVSAHDPDAATVSGTATVTDGQGNEMSGPFSFPVSDPLSYAATVDSGTLTQDSQDPSQFVWSP